MDRSRSSKAGSPNKLDGAFTFGKTLVRYHERLVIQTGEDHYEHNTVHGWRLRQKTIAQTLQSISDHIETLSVKDVKDIMFDLGSPRPDFSVSSPRSVSPNWAVGGPWGKYARPGSSGVHATLLSQSDHPVTHPAHNLLFDLLCYDGSRDCAFFEIAAAFEHTPGFGLSLYVTSLPRLFIPLSLVSYPTLMT